MFPVRAHQWSSATPGFEIVFTISVYQQEKTSQLFSFHQFYTAAALLVWPFLTQMASYQLLKLGNTQQVTREEHHNHGKLTTFLNSWRKRDGLESKPAWNGNNTLLYNSCRGAFLHIDALIRVKRGRNLMPRESEHYPWWSHIRSVTALKITCELQTSRKGSVDFILLVEGHIRHFKKARNN